MRHKTEAPPVKSAQQRQQLPWINTSRVIIFAARSMHMLQSLISAGSTKGIDLFSKTLFLSAFLLQSIMGIVVMQASREPVQNERLTAINVNGVWSRSIGMMELLLKANSVSHLSVKWARRSGFGSDLETPPQNQSWKEERNGPRSHFERPI